MRRILFVSLMIVALLLTACGSPQPTAAPQVVKETVEVVVTKEVEKEIVVTKEVEKEVVKEIEVVALPEVNPLEVTGDIVTAGSSTVYPLSEAMAERF